MSNHFNTSKILHLNSWISKHKKFCYGFLVLFFVLIIGNFGYLSSGVNNTALVLDSMKPQIILNVESQDKLEVLINGSVGPTSIGVVSVTWNWGDGSKNDGFFPQSHIYSKPGKYKIVTTARSLFGGNEGYAELFVTVPAHPPQLELSDPVIKNMTLSVNGYVQDANRLVWNWGDGKSENSWFPAVHSYSKGGTYEVTVKALGRDKISLKTFSITVPRVDELTTLKGSQSIFFKFPKRFFDESIVMDKQILAVTDAQFLSLKKMHNGLTPYSLTKIEYNSIAYGMTTPEGIVLGDSAFPSLNGGNPRWEVMSHEQGHNFFGGTSAFL